MKTNQRRSNKSVVIPIISVLIAAAWGITQNLEALTVVSGPSFTPASAAPLAGTLKISTDVGSQVSISVNDGLGTWERDFYDYATNHSLMLAGFKPDRVNKITVSVRDKNRTNLTVANPLTFTTPQLPGNFPTMNIITDNPAKMEPGYFLFRAINFDAGQGFVTLMDTSGAVVWYAPDPDTIDVQQLTNGDFFVLSSTSAKNGFNEVNLLGQVARTWNVPADLPVDEHENLMTDHGSILYFNYFGQNIPDFPSSADDPSAPPQTTDVTECAVIEISATNSSLLNRWSLVDMLDPLRINYLCFLLPQLYGVDPEHANAVIEVPGEDSLIVSMRDQDAVIKFTRSGQLKWILGPHENWGAQWQPYLLTPVGTPFAWNYAQHRPYLTPSGTLLLYDDGNERAEPFDPPVSDANNYSRAVEYSINESNMTVSQVWQFTGTNTDRLYTGTLGSVEWLPHTSNVLVDFGNITFENGVAPVPADPAAGEVHIKEVTHEDNPEVVFDLKLSDPNTQGSSGVVVYRAHLVPDIYTHPPEPVATLTTQQMSNQLVLQFTADPFRSYVVQSSSDLTNWTGIGSATADDANGDFSFATSGNTNQNFQFYRVLTK